MPLNFFLVKFALEESLEKILAMEMVAKLWCASRIPDIGMRSDWLLGESVVQSQMYPESTSMFTTT